MENRNLFIAVGAGFINFRLLGWLINPNRVLFGIESEVVVMCSFISILWLYRRGIYLQRYIYIYYRISLLVHHHYHKEYRHGSPSQNTCT